MSRFNQGTQRLTEVQEVLKLIKHLPLLGVRPCLSVFDTDELCELVIPQGRLHCRHPISQERNGGLER